MLWTLPNILTVSRMLLIPVMMLIFFLPYSWSSPVTAVIFSLAAITDWLDGYLARRLKQHSAFGAFLDPVADKLMVAVALVLVLYKEPTLVLAVATAVIIGREITISALREWMAELGKRASVSVSALGKFKTTFQMIAIILLLYREPLFGISIYHLGYVCLIIAAILTVVSMLIYLRAAWPYMKENAN
ncbi:MAG: CDP-diacylglycerol--glycerol-3-phosphate 3-phosphatidyltransferase [Gammaproteobacteria bacterium]|nr:CDP-diacylglycerol--glycerol-3-phosphate 3-phosphatidyltransferase [Gammaproteobacteria bacterium]